MEGPVVMPLVRVTPNTELNPRLLLLNMVFLIATWRFQNFIRRHIEFDR